MTEQQKELIEFARAAAVVIEWIVDTMAPPTPLHIERYLIEMQSALLKLDGTEQLAGD